MSRLRVLSLIGDLKFGGAETRVLSLARNIDRTRFDHFVGVLNRPEPVRERTAGTLRPFFHESGIDLIELGEPFEKADKTGRSILKTLNGLLALRRMVAKVCRIIRAHDIQLIDSHLWSANLVGTLAGRLCGIRTVATQYVPENTSWVILAGSRTYLALTHALVSDSRIRASEIAAGRQRLRVAIIPNGIDQPKSEQTSAQMRQRLGLPLDSAVRVVGQISGIAEHKGHRVLVDAARRVVDRCPQTVFLFVGYARDKPEYLAQLRAQVDRLGLSDHVRITGYPGLIADVWNVIDVHVHASLYDSLPIAITEGMATGKPAVVTSVGGIPTMVEHDVTGLVVPPGDADALAAALLRLLEEPETAERLGRAAYRRYCEEYRPAIMARRLEALFEELVTARRRQAPQVESGVHCATL